MRRREPAARAADASVFAALASPVYRRLWAAGVVSQLGDWMQIFGRAALAYRITGEASSVGIVYFATYLPQMLFSLWGGVLADRFDRRRLFVWTQVAQAAGAAALAVLVARDAASLLAVAAISLFIGVFFMLAIPAGQALLPGVVPRSALHSAISLGTSTNSVTRVLGPLAGAGVVATLGLQWVFWINAVSFGGVILVWATTRVPRQPRLGEVRNRDAILAATRYVRSTACVWVPIAIGTFLSSVGIVYQPLSIVYATRVLADGDTALGVTRNGFVQAAIGLGAAVGILALAGIGRRRPAATLLATAVVFSVALATLGRVTTPVPALALCAVLGAMQLGNMALGINLVQHEVPEAMRGRVMAIQMLGLIGFVPVASLAGGALADRFGVGAVFTGAGIACLAFSAYAIRWRTALRPRLEPSSDETLAAVGVLEEEG